MINNRPRTLRQRIRLNPTPDHINSLRRTGVGSVQVMLAWEVRLKLTQRRVAGHRVPDELPLGGADAGVVLRGALEGLVICARAVDGCGVGVGF